MPINYFQPLDSLKGLNGSGLKPRTPSSSGIIPRESSAPLQPYDNPDADLLNLQDQRRSELLDNAGKGLAMAAPGNTLKELDTDIASNPITRQAPEVADTLARQRHAQLAGFNGPQDEAKFGRDLEVKKVESPATVANITGKYGLENQQLQNTGGLDIAKEHTKGLQASQDISLLKQLLMNNGRIENTTTNNISRQLADLERQHTIGVGGRRIPDEEYTRRKAEIQSQGQPQSNGGGISSADFARKLRTDYPRASLSQLKVMAQSRDNEIGGIDDPNDLNLLEQDLIRLGARD